MVQAPAASGADALLRQGVAAYRAGDHAAARRLLERVADGAAPDSPAWPLLARLYRAAGEGAREEAAVDRVLEADSRDLAGLVMKGDCLVRRGDDRNAASFYATALRVGAEAPAAAAALLAHAERSLAGLHDRFRAHLEARLAGAGFPAGGRPPRFAAAMDLLHGRAARPATADRYPQEPTSFFYPGVPLRAFYERGEFPWLAAMEAAAPAMRAELEAVLRDADAFRPYMHGEGAGPRNHHELVGDPSWSAFHLRRDGAWVAENARRCPRTAEALALAPQPDIPGRAPNAMFSLLRPGAHIAPHSGILNTQLICHIPLVTPPGCALRVGAETRGWRPGEALVFDDSVEHEAWNRSTATRVVLLFEIWRPELAPAERTAVATLLAAIEEYRA